MKNLPAEFNGFTIVQLPDLHVGTTVGWTMLDRVVKTTNQLNPDAVAITGDLVDATVYQIRQAVKPLLKLRARYGVYYVTGMKYLFSVEQHVVYNVCRDKIWPNLSLINKLNKDSVNVQAHTVGARGFSCTVFLVLVEVSYCLYYDPCVKPLEQIESCCFDIMPKE